MSKFKLRKPDPAFKKKMAKAEDVIRRYRKALRLLAK
jgi:hypothetical protein